MGDAIKLIGIVIVIIGFALKFDTLATVVVAGIVTGLVGGMSIMDILSTLGAAFLTNRTATLFILTLPVIGICERMGLRDKAVDFIRGIKSADNRSFIINLASHSYNCFSIFITYWRTSTIYPSFNQPNGTSMCDC